MRDLGKKIQNPDTFQSSGTSETFKINRRLTFDDKCLVICLHVKHAQNSILKKSQISADSNVIIINLMTESLGEKNIACKNIYMDIFLVMAITISLRKLQERSPKKLMAKILKTRKTMG